MNTFYSICFILYICVFIELWASDAILHFARKKLGLSVDINTRQSWWYQVFDLILHVFFYVLLTLTFYYYDLINLNIIIVFIGIAFIEGVVELLYAARPIYLTNESFGLLRVSPFSSVFG